MLNISSSQPMSWPTAPPAPAMAPVGAVPSVGAVQSSARESQTDSGRHGQGSQGNGANTTSRAGADGQSTAVQAAPLLPRERGDDRSASPAVQAEEARVRTEQQKADDQKAREKAEQKLQLQEVLASVWKASAAVVDVVLGRESVDAANAADPDTVGKVAPATGLPVQTPVSAEVMLSGGQDGMADPVALRREQEPVAYTEQGASSWPPMEAGLLLSQRV